MGHRVASPEDAGGAEGREGRWDRRRGNILQGGEGHLWLKHTVRGPAELRVKSRWKDPRAPQRFRPSDKYHWKPWQLKDTVWVQVQDQKQDSGQQKTYVDNLWGTLMATKSALSRILHPQPHQHSQENPRKGMRVKYLN